MALTRFTAYVHYNKFDLSFMDGTCRLSNGVDNTWKLDSAQEILSTTSDSATLVITGSGTNPVAHDGDLVLFDMKLLINSSQVSEFHTSLEFLPQNNKPDTTRDECVAVTTKGNVTYITSCFMNGRFVNISDTPFMLYSVNPHPATDGVAKISYSVAFEAPTKIEIITETGEVVATPVNTIQKKGNYVLNVDLSSMASGMYMVRMTTANNVFSHPLIISK
jgi:hypothetical protein